MKHRWRTVYDNVDGWSSARLIECRRCGMHKVSRYTQSRHQWVYGIPRACARHAMAKVMES